MQAVRQVVSAAGLQDRVYQFSRLRLHFRISSRRARLAEKHYKSKHCLSGIVEKGVMVGFTSRTVTFSRSSLCLRMIFRAAARNSPACSRPTEVFVQDVSCL